VVSTKAPDILGQVATVILDSHFRPRAGQRVLVLSGEDKLDLGERLRKGLVERGSRPELVIVDQAAEALPRVCLESFDCPTIGLIVLTSLRMWSELGLSSRFLYDDGPTLSVACQPVFFDEVLPLDSLLRIYSSDPEDDERYLTNLKSRLQGGAPARVTAQGGTDLTFIPQQWSLRGRELLTSPVEATVDGKIVADASVYLGSVRRPITLTVERGRLTDIACPDLGDPVFRAYREEMVDRFHLSPANRQLAEVGFGGNGGARLSGCIMEDESVRGTCHFCFGDNTRYGGTNRSAWHGGTVVVGGVQVRQ